MLTSDPPILDGPAAITGAASKTVVERDAEAYEFSVFVMSSGVATLENLEIAGGSVPHYHGGGIQKWGGDLTIRSGVMRDNTARYGGGIFQFVYETGTTGKLDLDDVEFARNSATYGGAIANPGGAMRRPPWTSPGRSSTTITPATASTTWPMTTARRT